MFTVRLATVEDLEVLVQLRVAMQSEVSRTTGGSGHLPSFEDATRRYFQETLGTGEFLAWLAEADGAIVGTSGLVFFRRAPTPRNLLGRDAYVLNMYTTPEWRGRGVASALLAELIAYVRTTGVCTIRLHAEKGARPIYSRAGFVARDDEMELRLEDPVPVLPSDSAESK